MKTENNVPSTFATTTHANFEGGVQVDVYLRYEMPVAVVLWRGSEPHPASLPSSPGTPGNEGREVEVLPPAKPDTSRLAFVRKPESR